MALRPTTEDDLPALHALFLASLGGVFEPHGFASPAPPLDVFSAQQGHIQRTGTSVLAEEDGELAGFASAWVRGEDWYLASLFVAPTAQGRGVGRALLDAVWGRHRRRRTITDAIQPVSNTLYGRRGLSPVTPLLTFAGEPHATTRIRPAPADLAGIDAVAYGFDRAADHAYWSTTGSRTTWPNAYSYVFPGGAIGPVAGLTPAAAAQALEAELARAEGAVSVRVPGSATKLVQVALAAGLRQSSVPGLLLLSDAVEAPTALAPASYTLF